MNLERLKTEIDKINLVKEEFKSIIDTYNKIIIIGNGGSNAIASHIVVDYTKFLNKQAFGFFDSPRLTAYINDYGRDEAYVKFISEFATPETLIILISSSGNSMNIVNVSKYCDDNSIKYIALSGFEKSNKLNNTNAIFKYWVDSNSYGIVECAHEILLHSIVNN